MSYNSYTELREALASDPTQFIVNQTVTVVDGKRTSTYRLSQMMNLVDKKLSLCWIHVPEAKKTRTKTKQFDWTGFKANGERAAAKTVW
jgi:hypothetical protein